MRRPRRQFRLGTMMRGVVVVALICLVARWPAGPYLMVTLAGLAAAVVAIAHVGKMSRSRAAGGLAGVYPWLVLALFHLIALLNWWRGQHPFAIEPDALGIHRWTWKLVQIVAVCLAMGTPVAGLACLVLAVGQAFLVVDHRPANQGDEVARLILIPLFSWLGAF